MSESPQRIGETQGDGDGLIMALDFGSIIRATPNIREGLVCVACIFQFGVV